MKELTNIKQLPLNEEDDFGFTFTDSQDAAMHTGNKLLGLKNMIMPLLNNLMKDTDKDTILWPNRVDKIKTFIKKMDDYIQS